MACSGESDEPAYSGVTRTYLIYLDTDTLIEKDPEARINAWLRICTLNVAYNTNKVLRKRDWSDNPVDRFLNSADYGCTDHPNEANSYRKTGSRTDTHYNFDDDGDGFSSNLDRETLELYDQNTFSRYGCSVIDASGARDLWNQIFADQRAAHVRIKGENQKANKI